MKIRYLIRPKRNIIAKTLYRTRCKPLVWLSKKISISEYYYQKFLEWEPEIEPNEKFYPKDQMVQMISRNIPPQTHIPPMPKVNQPQKAWKEEAEKMVKQLKELSGKSNYLINISAEELMLMIKAMEQME